MIMITCKTVECPMGDEKHYPHPDGIMVVCCFCGVEMTPDETPVEEAVVDEPVVEVVIDDE
jgi:hypothetical protein